MIRFFCQIVQGMKDNLANPPLDDDGPISTKIVYNLKKKRSAQAQLSFDCCAATARPHFQTTQYFVFVRRIIIIIIIVFITFMISNSVIDFLFPYSHSEVL